MESVSLILKKMDFFLCNIWYNDYIILVTNKYNVHILTTSDF